MVVLVVSGHGSYGSSGESNSSNGHGDRGGDGDSMTCGDSSGDDSNKAMMVLETVVAVAMTMREIFH